MFILILAGSLALAEGDAKGAVTPAPVVMSKTHDFLRHENSIGFGPQPATCLLANGTSLQEGKPGYKECVEKRQQDWDKKFKKGTK